MIFETKKHHARTVCGDSETIVEILVQGDYAVSVEYGYEHEGYDHLSDGEAHGHLHI